MVRFSGGIIPLYDYTTFNDRAIVQTLPVGSTPGTGNVSGNGGASYSIPITVPPGTNGIVPSISLEYNSQSGSGIAGMGWNLSGLSVITRVPSNTYFDGESKPVEISANDRFALNGQRLISENGVYGAAGSTYGTETEDFSVITSVSSVGGGPQYFEVLSKDGVLMEFGKTADSQFSSESSTAILFWRLNKVRYPDGNYIIYEYSDTSISGVRDSRLLKIKYTGNDIQGAIQAPYNVIEFSYKIREQTTVNGTFSDVRTVYEAGSSIVSKYLLDLVTVTAEGAVAKKYQLEYGHNNINSYLKSVTEYGSDGSHLNPTIFKYGDAPQDYTLTTNTTLPVGSIDYFSGDFDGNGKSDIVLAEYTGGGYFRPDLFPKKYTSIKIARDGNPANLSTTIALNDGSQLPNRFMKDYAMSMGDFNGDGLNDVFTSQVEELTVEGQKTLQLKSAVIFKSNLAPGGLQTDPLSFSLTNIILNSQYRNIPDKGNYIFSGDFDGNGIDDVLTITKANPSSGGNNAHKAIFHKFHSNSTLTDPYDIILDTNGSLLGNTWAAAAKIYILDFNGDGKDDVMTVEGSQCRIYTSVTNAPGGQYSFKLIYSSSSFIIGQDNSVQLGDFNADGKTDILYRHALVGSGDPDTAPWTVAISTGKDFISTTFTFSTQASPLNNIISVSDFNGDGKSDIFRQFYGSVSTNNVEIYYSTGDAFYKSEQFSHTSLRDSDKPWTVCDLNGDGRSEILFRNQPGTCTVISPKKDGPENTLQKVQNGLGHTIEWAYKSLSAGGSFYNKGSVSLTDYPFNKIQIPLFTVSEYQLPDGIGGTSTIQYSYEGARMHRAGKGFMGFTRVTASNLTMGVKTVSENEFNSTYYVAVPKQTSTFLIDANNTPVSSTTLTNTFVSPAAKRFWVKTSNIHSVQTLEGREVSTINIYDDLNGNITKSTVNNSVETTTTDTEYGSYLTSFLNRPTLITVNKSRAGNTGSFSVKTKMVYNTVNAQLETKTDFFGTAKEIIKSYQYHPRGSLKKTTTTAYEENVALPSRSNTLEVYDDFERFPKTIKNELEQISTLTYDQNGARWGKPQTVTGIDGLTTTYSYDAFGRSTTTINPGSYTLTQTYEWAINEGFVWKSRSSYSTPSGLPTQGRPESTVYYDLLGRERRSLTKGFDGSDIMQFDNYDNKGNLIMSTEPHKSQTAFNYSIREYNDSYNRLTSVNNGPLGVTTYLYEYNNGILKLTTTTPTGASSKETDASGKVISATDDGGKLTYSYYNHGGLNEVKKDNVILTKNEYDIYGRQTKLTDANAGVITYLYDAFDQLTKQVSSNGHTSMMSYNVMGQITSRKETTSQPGVDVTTSYIYGTTNTSGESKNLIKEVSGFTTNNKTTYIYNGLGRIQSMTETVDNVGHTTSFTYNNFGDVITTTYPSQLVISNEYNIHGYLTKINNGSTSIYSTTAMNGQGQVTDYLKGNKSSNIQYANGLPTKYETLAANSSTFIQKLSMVWDYQKGNLTSRSDGRGTVKTESFTYDNLNRLTSSSISGILGTFSTTYLPNGNIDTKTDAGTYTYHATKFNAVVNVTNLAPASPIPLMQQDITYTPFMQPEKVKEGNYELIYTYGSDYERIKSVLKNGTTDVYTRHYFSNGYEKDNGDGTDRELHYITSPAGLAAIIVKQNNTFITYYTYTDHLGSILTLTDASANVVTSAEQSFDAWGRRRNPSTWALLPPTTTAQLPPVWLYRGYTGHEHLDQFGLINMNGRMYDPVLGRMLSPDNYVPDGGFTQDYNRYSYARNNPLIYTDPDGQFVFGMLAGQFIGTVAGMFAGGISAYYVAKNNGATHGQSVLAAFGGAVVGGAIGYGLGSIDYGSLFDGWSSGAAQPVLSAARQGASSTPSLYGPIFDIANGAFMGVTSNSFQGGLLFMSQNHFSQIVKASSTGLPSQQAALQYGKPMFNPSSQAQVNVINSALDYVSKRTDVSMYGMDASSFSEIHNGSVSTYYYEGANSKTGEFDAWAANGGSPMHRDWIGLTKGNKITFNSNRAYDLLNTVENIQSVFVHEFVGHYKMSIPGGITPYNDHFKAMQLQRAHPTWSKTTPYFRANHLYDEWRKLRLKIGIK